MVCSASKIVEDLIGKKVGGKPYSVKVFRTRMTQHPYFFLSHTGQGFTSLLQERNRKDSSAVRRSKQNKNLDRLQIRHYHNFTESTCRIASHSGVVIHTQSCWLASLQRVAVGRGNRQQLLLRLLLLLLLRVVVVLVVCTIVYSHWQLNVAYLVAALRRSVTLSSRTSWQNRVA